MMITLKNVTKEYNKGNIGLEDVSLDIAKGEFVFIVGKSGSGKTTLMKLLQKELDVTSGQIIVNGQDYKKLTQRNLPKFRRQMGMVFQDFRLLKDRTIFENVAFAQQVVEVPHRYIKRQVENMLEMVGLKDRMNAFPNELSGGEQQRVAIARALANHPVLLLADEPTGNLDPVTAKEIMELLSEINKSGTTVLVVTHNKELVNEMGKRVILIEDGHIEQDEIRGPMIFRRFLYGIKEGTRNIFRNKMFSLASLGTIIACVFLLGTFLSVALNVRSTMQQMEQSVGISVFFEPGISTERKDQIGEEIKKKEDIATMRYVSAEEAWESYKKDVFQGNEELLEGFEGNNPLKESDSYEITLKEVKSYKQVVSHLETIDGVRKVRYSEGAAEGMMKINTMGTYLAGGIILILMAVSIFLVSNTVSIGVAVREEEISIMKLIGAANGFIKAPFQAEGMIIGILGSLIPTAIIFAGYEGIINWMNDKFHVVTVFMRFVPIQQIMLYLLPLALLVGIVIGLLGSSITIRKYLKV